MTVFVTDEFLEALGMSHGDLANYLRTSLKSEHPGQNTWVWCRDVYDDAVVYEVSSGDQNDLYKRSYEIDEDGKISFGDPVKVIATTKYVPVEFEESEDEDELEEREFDARQRKAMAKSGQAMSDGSFPIANVSDLKNAIKAYGRATNKKAAMSHIKRRARALGRMELLPDDWKESESIDLEFDTVPLVEKAVRKDGTINIKIIQPGQGSSGYYSKEVLERDGPKVFKKGLHMYADHPTTAEEKDRPERSIRDLVGTLASDAEWKEDGQDGPGLYAKAKVNKDIAPLVEDIAPHIGVSIRAYGKAKQGEVDGKKVTVIEGIEHARSVDLVTIPGAGGKVLDLMESARSRREQELPEMSDDTTDLVNALNEANRKIDELTTYRETQERRAREAEIMSEARSVSSGILESVSLPPITRNRLVERLSGNPPIKEDKLDKEAFVEQVKKAAEEEAKYLTEATGNRTIVDMGDNAAPELKIEEIRERQAAAFMRLGMSESAAKVAAAGRA